MQLVPAADRLQLQSMYVNMTGTHQPAAGSWEQAQYRSSLSEAGFGVLQRSQALWEASFAGPLPERIAALMEILLHDVSVPLLSRHHAALVSVRWMYLAFNMNTMVSASGLAAVNDVHGSSSRHIGDEHLPAKRRCISGAGAAADELKVTRLGLGGS